MDNIRITKGKALWTSNFTPPKGPNQWTVNNIAEGQGLLIHSNTTNGDTNFIDSSGRGHIITKYGNVAHNTTTKKFGTSSIYFDGSGDYLIIPASNDWNMGTNDWTVDFWIKADSSVTPITIFNIGQGDGVSYSTDLSIRAENSNIFRITDSGTTNHDLSFPFSNFNNTWQHIAIIRNNNRLLGFRNGNLFVNISVSGVSFGGNSKTVYIGYGSYAADINIYSNMNLDELRVTKGKALWTSNFTPPIAPASVLNAPSADQMIDNPTNNFATLNPINKHSDITLKDGNLLTSVGTQNVNKNMFGTIGYPTSGKWYWEGIADHVTGSYRMGFGLARTYSDLGTSDNPWGSTNTWRYMQDAYKANGVRISYGTTYTSGDVIGVLYDANSGNLSYWKNGNDNGIAFTISDKQNLIPYIGLNYDAYASINFGQSQNGTQWCPNTGGYFKYCPPTGYKALSTRNLPNPAINISKNYFGVVNYTGTGAVRNITGLSFKPDVLWFKERNAANHHRLVDSIRGPTQELYSSLNLAEYTEATRGVNEFLTNGFSLKADSGAGYNINSNTYVTWAWKESQTAGFDIVNYTGNGPGTSFTHNLNTTPEFVLLKNLNGSYSWVVWHKNLTNLNYDLYLDRNLGEQNNGVSMWTFNNTSVTLPTSHTSFNTLNNNYIAYLFAEKDGFSKFGKYTGNGLADGPFVYTGFKPRYIMIKTSSGGTGDWVVYDTIRDTYNPAWLRLKPNLADSETTASVGNWYIDILSNGFKLRNTGTDSNGNGWTYIYIAFAEYPFR